MEPKPQIPPHSSVSPSCGNGEGQAEHRRSERLQTTSGRTRDRIKPKVFKAAPKQSQITTASTKREGNRRVASCGDENTAVSKSFRHKGVRGSSQNTALPSAKAQMDCTTSEKSCDSAKDKDTPESPTAAKRWVIGPLLHSFKSKMASFSEIVMSPVRLFKPTDSLSSGAIGLHDRGALSFNKTADNSSDSVHNQQAHVTQKLQFDGSSNEVTGDGELLETAGELKCKVEPPERECDFASSRLTRGVLLRDEQPVHLDPPKSCSNQSVLGGPPEHCGDSSSSNDGDDAHDAKTIRLPDSSVFDTPPDSFSKADAAPAQEDLEEGTAVQNAQICSSPRKLPKSISVTPAPFAAYRPNSRQKGMGRKVTFNEKVKGEEEKGESQRSSCVSSDEEVGLPQNDDEATLKRPQPEERKRTRKPLETDLEWAVKAKRRIKAEKVEGATRRRGKKKDVSPKECLSEWLEISEDILYTQTSDNRVTDSGTNLLSSSHESTVDIEMSEVDMSDAALKLEGSNRLTRGQARSKQSTPAPAKVDQLENEYADCFTDCLAVSFYADKSHNDNSTNGRDNEDTITGSLSRKPRQPAKKTAALDDSNLVTNRTKLKSEDEGSFFFSPNLSNSTGSLLSTTALEQSNSKSGRGTKRRLMKKRGQMYDEFPDDSPSASILKLDKSVSETRDSGEKSRQENMEQICKENSTDESERMPSERGCPKALKRKSPSSSTKENCVDGTDNGEEDDNAFMDTEKVPEATATGSGSNRLMRSNSCPEIPSLSHHDQPWRSPTLPLHGRAPPLPTPHRPVLHPSPHLPPSPSKRARRHTVCSVEIEREIAPLCLRKEVYPTGRGGLYGSPSHPLCPIAASPSTSFTALVSSFLSSPLAFLSRRSDRGKRKAHDDDSLSTSSSSSSSLSPGATLSCSTSSPPFASSSAVHHSLPGFTCSAPPRSSHFSASVSQDCSSHSEVFSEGEEDSGQQSEDGEENRCSVNLDLLSREMPEEKALSDSEIKMETKQGEQGKVSSIRIRKTLPKPLKNLTPMGLPKLIRPKKKEFSIEEIYTNKNFTKPAEGRLETIFEAPLKRRDGSHCLLGQKRVKRFVEFPELGLVRKLRKPLVCAGTGSSTQKKTSGQSSGGRPRRGAWSTSQDDPRPEDLDSLLCSKLDQLDSLMSLMDEGTS
ncbi:uncharacterized protein prr14 isoform X1 [Clupea harengus]|uniref:Uncharacterized protein prr14 isoform X1 n=1 Tax=Clupea harengus TaxID=7950 RepID=A0A6P8FPU5_CLUHA|nr:uncharacterized protein prr14 isoform X1 [Clupea harengus]XP_031428409.1 uncharacterized protein prr14 isoform X1 [Clupea harengus]